MHTIGYKETTVLFPKSIFRYLEYRKDGCKIHFTNLLVINNCFPKAAQLKTLLELVVQIQPSQRLKCSVIVETEKEVLIKLNCHLGGCSLGCG